MVISFMLIEKRVYEEFTCNIHFFCFWPEVSFFGNLFQKLKLFAEAEI